MRICLVYDCLYPHTIGGAERWYRNLGQRLSSEGHHVTYLTLRQWDRGATVDVPGVEVIAVGPRLALYTPSGRRRIGPPVVFGLGVLWHLLRRGRSFDVVHTASFPYFSLLAAAAVRPLAGFRLVVDWHELWTDTYWREYLGRYGGAVGAAIQRACLQIPQRAFCFAHLTARRLRAERVRGEVTVLEGEYEGTLEPTPPIEAEPLIVFAGRHIPEKRVATLVPALRRAREQEPELRALIFGDGPERGRLLAEIRAHGLEDAIEAPGFVDGEQIQQALARAACMVLPSRREGYGLIVVEAASKGVPSVVVRGEDNAAVDLVDEGENGVVAASALPQELADAIVGVYRAGPALRARTAAWFRANAQRLSLDGSLRTVAAAYADDANAPPSDAA